jgi:hypothetical protein
MNSIGGPKMELLVHVKAQYVVVLPSARGVCIHTHSISLAFCMSALCWQLKFEKEVSELWSGKAFVCDNSSSSWQKYMGLPTRAMWSTGWLSSCTEQLQGVQAFRIGNVSTPYIHPVDIVRPLMVMLEAINRQCMGEDRCKSEGRSGTYRGMRVNSAPNFTTGVKSAQRLMLY